MFNNTVALTGKDTLILNGISMVDLADQDTASLVYNDNIMTAKKGKNGNTIYTLNSGGELAELTIRVIKGSRDDKYLNNLLNLQKRNFASFVLITGEFIKRVGDGAGNVTKDIYQLSGGMFSKNVDTKENVEGDTETGVSVYMITFSSAPRSLT